VERTPPSPTEKERPGDPYAYRQGSAIITAADQWVDYACLARPLGLLGTT